jgi:hypothetical protein
MRFPKTESGKARSLQICPGPGRRQDGGAIMVVASVVWDPVALRMKQLSDHDVGPNLQEVTAGQRPEWKGIADISPMHKG